MTRVGDITVDGKVIGTIDIEWLEGAVVLPQSSIIFGDGAAIDRKEPTFRPGIGPGSRRHGQGKLPEHYKGGPTFRPHLTPRGKAPPAKPEHFTVADIKDALTKRPAGGINRSWQRAELEANPSLKEKLFRHALGENTNPQANQAIMEEAANRADIRRELHGGVGGMADHSNLSYFQGYYHGVITPAMREMLEENYRKVFVEGSDISHGAIDNSSSGLALREIGYGRFKNVANYGGDGIPGHYGVESFHIPGTWESGAGERKFYPTWRARQLEEATGVRRGITRLPADPNYKPQDERPAIPVGSGRVSEEQQGATRSLPISSELRNQLQYAAEQAGVHVHVGSGGQPEHGGHRVGSHRHDLGHAADVTLTDDHDGHELDMRNPQDALRMEKFTSEAVRAGATGVGAGEGYMGPHAIHIGGGTVASWGGAPWIGRALHTGLSAARVYLGTTAPPTGKVTIGTPVPKSETTEAEDALNDLLNK